MPSPIGLAALLRGVSLKRSAALDEALPSLALGPAGISWRQAFAQLAAIVGVAVEPAHFLPQTA